jgi:hypothetical protein
LRNTAIYVVLFLALAITSVFWLRVFRIGDLPPAKISSRSTEKEREEAEAFVKLANELLIDDKKPLPALRGRDPFVMVVETKVQPLEIKQDAPKILPVLSSVSYSDLSPLAVMDGKIVAEGDTIVVSESEFMIEKIEIDRVEISDGEDTYTIPLR